MNSQNLIPVFSGSLSDSETLLCDARKLHEFLQVETRFNDWINRRIEEYGFVENQDFVFGYSNLSNQNKRGGNRKAVTEYHITLDMAKELAMVERNEQGKAARRYFIECEKKLHEAQRLPEKRSAPRLPAKIRRRIRSRDDLSFTRRKPNGDLINWQPPLDENGMYDWYDAYAIGQEWFGEVAELAHNNAEEAYYALYYVPRLMSAYAQHTEKQGMGFVEGFFSKLARYALAAVLTHTGGVVFPFASDLERSADLERYLAQAASLPDDELRWQAWEESEPCRRACYENRLRELMAAV